MDVEMEDQKGENDDDRMYEDDRVETSDNGDYTSPSQQQPPESIQSFSFSQSYSRHYHPQQQQQRLLHSTTNQTTSIMMQQHNNRNHHADRTSSSRQHCTKNRTSSLHDATSQSPPQPQPLSQPSTTATTGDHQLNENPRKTSNRFVCVWLKLHNAMFIHQFFWLYLFHPCLRLLILTIQLLNHPLLKHTIIQLYNTLPPGFSTYTHRRYPGACLDQQNLSLTIKSSISGQ